MTSLCPDVILLRWAQSAEGCECLGREEGSPNPWDWIREAENTSRAGPKNTAEDDQDKKGKDREGCVPEVIQADGVRDRREIFSGSTAEVFL